MVILKKFYFQTIFRFQASQKVLYYVNKYISIHVDCSFKVAAGKDDEIEVCRNLNRRIWVPFLPKMLITEGKSREAESKCLSKCASFFSISSPKAFVVSSIVSVTQLSSLESGLC